MSISLDEVSINKRIQNKYRQLLKACPDTVTKVDKKLIRKAFNLAVEAHKGMTRKSGEPYVFHPIEVAIICAKEMSLATTSIICALLHDVVEDTDYTLEDIKLMFGDKIVKIVDGLTKISGFFSSPKVTQSVQAENFRKILLTLSEDIRVVIIKLADRLHNMRTLDSLNKEKQYRIASETSYLYAPLANRLGFYAIKSEMEDLVLKYTEPEVYNSLSRKLSATEHERKRFTANFILPIKQALVQNGIKCTILSREKSISSIWNKMKKKQIPFEEVYDLFAVRILVDSTFANEHIDCMKTLAIIEGIYKRNPERFRNWLFTPKANGYQALHTTVMSKTGKWVEVQIRSNRMNEIAEKGYAAHFKYKNIKETNDTNLDQWLNRVREVLQNKDPDVFDFMDNFKTNLFSDEVYVFTPKGEMKTLTREASILDFAYNIHSNIGNQCIGAKVNNKLVPLNYKLKTGDQIEIITSKKQFPKEDWLKWTNTAKAKSFIKNALKEEKKTKIEEGKKQLKEIFEKLDIEFNEKYLSILREYLAYPNNQELFNDIASNKVQLNDIKTATKNKAKWKEYFTRPFKKVTLNSNPQNEEILTENEKLDQITTENIEPKGKIFAKCCNPIPGDDIIGFNEYSIIHIHRTNCPKAVEMSSTFGHKIVKIKWSSENKVYFLSTIKIQGNDKIGIIKDISRVISEELNVNIRSFNLESKAEMFEGDIKLYVQDIYHLKMLIHKLSKIDGIKRIYRAE